MWIPRTTQLLLLRATEDVRGVNSAKGPDSSVGRVLVVNCPDVDHMEEEVQVSIQVEEKREVQGEEQSQRTNAQQHNMDDHEYEVKRLYP